MRLHYRSPAPDGWLRGWPSAKPARRCSCGARVVVRCERYARCERGCVALSPSPPPAVPEPPRPSARERAHFADLIVDLRLLERDFVRAQLKGRRPPAEKVERAFRAMELLWELCPLHGEQIVKALPWLSRQADRGRAA